MMPGIFMANHPGQDGDWLEKAKNLPLAFSQTREDPLLDDWVVNRLGCQARVAMIASGGCTAAFLAGNRLVASMDLVDANPAQLALTRLKLHLLESAAPEERRALLGHGGTETFRRKALPPLLSSLGLQDAIFGPLEWVCRRGPDHAGRYEAAFQRLAYLLETDRKEWQAILAGKTPFSTSDGPLDPKKPIGFRFDAVMEEVFSLSTLVSLFGEAATRNPVEPFSSHFAGRVRHVLANLPAGTNPFLWQMLACSYPPGNPAPWLDSPPVKNPPLARYHRAFMADFLGAARPGSFDLVHLSNILDWLGPEGARQTLAASARALRPGGLIFIRQLNSSLNITALGHNFHWLPDESNRLLARDRSFFYRALHLGEKNAGD